MAEQQRPLVYLEVVHHGDVCWGSGPEGVVDHCVFLWSGYATGGQDLVVLVHTQRLPT